jgi:ribonuclease J
VVGRLHGQEPQHRPEPRLRHRADGLLIKPAALVDTPPEDTVVLCTGSQGEPLSALTRIAYGDHPTVSVIRGDTVVLSAKPCRQRAGGHDTMNELWRSGARVLHQEIAPVHVSGHGSADELKTGAGARPSGPLHPGPR